MKAWNWYEILLILSLWLFTALWIYNDNISDGRKRTKFVKFNHTNFVSFRKIQFRTKNKKIKK